MPEILAQLDHISREDTEGFHAFKNELKKKISFMLDHHPDQLFNFFYRFDLDEQLVKSAVFSPQKESRASILCEMVIRRAILKIETRKKYS